MKKILNITEEDIIRVAKQVIEEQSKRKIRKQGRKRQTANVQKYLKKLADSDMNLSEASNMFKKGSRYVIITRRIYNGTNIGERSCSNTKRWFI